MPGQHLNPTMSFRPSAYERQQIEARILAAGMGKAKYITHTCIYSNVCVVGKKETILPLVYKLSEIEEKLTCISERIHEVNMEELTEIKNEYLATVDGILWMLHGAEYILKGE